MNTQPEGNTASEEKGTKSGRWRIPLIVIIVALCAGFTIFAIQPNGALRASVTQFFQMNKTAAAAEQITATATDSLTVRSAAGQNANVLFTLPQGTKVTIEENPDSQWVEIKTSDGKTGWADRNSLQFHPATASSSNGAVSSEADSSTASVSSKPASSQPAQSSQPPASTAMQTSKEDGAVEVSLQNAAKPLSIRVSISEQRVYVLDAKKRVVENFLCSTGKKGDDTPLGNFTVTDRGYSFYTPSVKEGAYYWVRFHGTFLFHSVPFDENRKMEPEEAAKLGEPASHGCVRTAMENAKWIYDNIPKGTKVVVEK